MNQFQAHNLKRNHQYLRNDQQIVDYTRREEKTGSFRFCAEMYGGGIVFDFTVVD